MCRWMGSHFHDWIDYNGVAFLVELLEVAHFRDFWEKILVSMDLKIGRSAVKRWFVLSVVLTFNSRLTLNSVLEILTETLTTCSTVLNPWVQNKVQQIIRATIFTFRLFCVVIVHRS